MSDVVRELFYANEDDEVNRLNRAQDRLLQPDYVPDPADDAPAAEEQKK